MKLDPGLIVVIAAVLIFYLRLIILQRQRVKVVNQPQSTPGSKKGKKAPPPAPPDYSIFSRKPIDRIIAGLGLVGIIIGVLMNRSIGFTWPVTTYWWIPVALGILVFSFGLK